MARRWWLPRPDELDLDARRRLLDRAEQGDQRAVRRLQSAYHLVYWGRAYPDRNIVI
jgi:hypothetical protein